jgi:isoaspartyl peptidase/L-asparaginase-like protein (Ntn-hydrolase superfamily)
MEEAQKQEQLQGEVLSKRSRRMPPVEDAAGDAADINDTVGGICVSPTEMATGVHSGLAWPCVTALHSHMQLGASSGGILYKDVGRVGPAAVAGAGCEQLSHPIDPL